MDLAEIAVFGTAYQGLVFPPSADAGPGGWRNGWWCSWMKRGAVIRRVLSFELVMSNGQFRSTGDSVMVRSASSGYFC